MKWISLAERQPSNLNHVHARWAKTKTKVTYDDYEVKLHYGRVTLVQDYNGAESENDFRLEDIEWLDESIEKSPTRIVHRVLMLPFFAIIYGITCTSLYFRTMWGYIKYGGESIVYSKGQFKTIQDVYNLLEQSINESK